MKKLILTSTFLVAGAIVVLAQGTINFNNVPFSYTDGIDRRVYLDTVGGTPVTDATWTAQLVQDGNPVGPAKAFYGTTVPGAWRFESSVALGVGVGQTATLAVRIANGQGTVLATSPTFSYTVPAPGSPPGDFLMNNFRAFAIPEPSTIALGVLGLGALLLFRRRK